MNPLLAVRELTKRFDAATEPVVDRIDFDVQPGEIFTLLGPSGCGKTTTLRLIAGFEHADAGQVELAGRRLTGPGTHIPPQHRKIGFVFQDYALFPHLSVLQNVTFGMTALPQRERRLRATEILAAVHMNQFADRRPASLSGGQQQRVALARSLAAAPKLMLLDEPFSNLDPDLRAATRDEVRSLLRRHTTTTILVTHDQEEALSFADTLAVMNEGRIEQIGAPESTYRQPRTPFVARFLGRTNLLEAVAAGEHAETPLGKMRLDRPAQGRVRLSVRSEHLQLHPPQADVPSGEVISREYKGHDITYTVRLAGTDYLVQTDYRGNYQVGDAVRLVASEPAVVLDTDVDEPIRE